MMNRFPTLKSYLKAIFNVVRKSLIRFFAGFPWLSRVYYAIISTAFQDENWAVLHGMRMFFLENSIHDDVQYGLRRNIHRLEKAILMRPRKDVFAQDYIEETLEWYVKCRQEEHISAQQEMEWAHDVLEEYFKIVKSTGIIQKARERFDQLPSCGDSSTKHIPYLHSVVEKSTTDYESLHHLAQQRKSVRWYLNKPVPRDLIDKAISLAALSPSACNRQPFEYRILDDPDLVREVASQVPGIRGFDQNLQSLAVVVGKLRAYFHERDRHLIYIDASLSSMAFMLALESLGISSCGINWPDQKNLNLKMARMIHLAPDERVVLLIAFGYADPEGMVAYSQKKELHLLRRYNNQSPKE